LFIGGTPVRKSILDHLEISARRGQKFERGVLRMAPEIAGIDKLVEESSYVFKATVTQLNASNEPAVQPGPGLLVAHVDEAFQASPSVGVRGLRGRDVTILLAAGAPALGDKLLVFANEWLYGAQIALREVAHHEATAEVEKEVGDWTAPFWSSTVKSLASRKVRSRMASRFAHQPISSPRFASNRPSRARAQGT